MDPKSWKRSIVFVLVLVACFAGYQYWNNYRPQKETERYRQYLNGRQQPLSSADSASIEHFYATLSKSFLAISKDSSVTSFSKIDKGTLPPDFEVRVCTWEWLDFISDGPLVSKRGSQSRKDYQQEVLPFHGGEHFQHLNTYLGNGDYAYELTSRQWNGGTRSETANAEKDRYLMVIKAVKWEYPAYIGKSESFLSGSFQGRLYAIDLSRGEIAGIMPVIAENDESVMTLPYKKDAMNEKLLENLVVNVRREVSRGAVSFFGLPLKEPDATHLEY